ncbi:hypothetical protein Q9189_004895 [Teloschistes chrysophthalmus]
MSIKFLTTVVDGRLRYAPTARHVKPDTVDPPQLHKSNYVTNPEDVYHGDMDAFELADKARAEEETKWMAEYPAPGQVATTDSE